MTRALYKAQAEHFDSHSPFTPAPRTLRTWGFKHAYILKDHFISQVLRRHTHPPGIHVLDVGCGTGILLDRLAATYSSIGYGIDISKASLFRLKSDCVHAQRASCARAESLPFRDACFDMVVTFDVLEHVDLPASVLSEMLRVLKPEGSIIGYAVSRRNRYTLNWFLSKPLDMLRMDPWTWAGHAPERLVDPIRIAEYLEQQGCRILLLEPFHSFFTILYDQSALALYWLASRISRSGQKGNSDGKLLTAILLLVSALSGVLHGPLVHLDRPWARRGLSNGFLFVAVRAKGSPQTPNQRHEIE